MYLLIVTIKWCSVSTKDGIVVTARVDRSSGEDDRFLIGNGNALAADRGQKQGVNCSYCKEKYTSVRLILGSMLV